MIRIDILSSVCDVYFILPLGCEAIEGNVHEHVDETHDFGAGIAFGFLCEYGEDGYTDGNGQGFAVHGFRVGRSLEEFAHDHDGYNFGGFEYSLHGKGYVSERSILRPTAQGIGESTGRECMKWRDIIAKDGSVT